MVFNVEECCADCGCRPERSDSFSSLVRDNLFVHKEPDVSTKYQQYMT